MVKVAGRCSRPIRGVPGQSHGPASATLGISIGVQFPSDWRAGHPDRGSGGCLGARRGTPRGRRPQRPGARPEQGCRRRRPTDHGIPGGLALDTVVLARDLHAEAAGRREQAASAHRRAAETAQREDEAAAQHDSEAAAQREGTAAAERHHTLQQAMIERRYLPSFAEGDRLRLGVTTPAGQARWLDAYASSSSKRRATIGWRPPTG